ncbi:MAG: molybdopterin-synthase adenylyltransferase MoeB [Gammaproteobacteria bacterium]|nr:molybdopterin-synthase adenylyltransferase MoeB [Gammaproteobacteria bacterium]MCW8911195.1 molybdopterin-synthase adenylyltransferase MoeB [Gammaproteobacteria bacterium]MCW9005060.1 molybdopterin-synthase adenylyltransferase MoeB [Gammaproteobacteria bacterium]MCW9055397.1 molybdopterin-synthase adenylyltransferase MoeB [Gammaproteobacteria bacterium]
MNDEQLLRYSRQILLPQFGIEGQQQLLDAHVLIIGLGGLGSPVAMYLAAAGVGQLTLADHDAVDLSNLQRQIIHRTHNIGQAKVESAKENLLQINPDIKINCVQQKLAEAEMDTLVQQVDVVVDATDNFPTRFAINKICFKNKKPLVSGAAIRMEGQVSIFDMRDTNSPCYHCLYDEEGTIAETCSENGVMSPMVGIIGSIQALETIKLISNTGEPLTGKLLITDGMHQEWRSMKLRKDPDCPVCSKR